MTTCALLPVPSAGRRWVRDTVKSLGGRFGTSTHSAWQECFVFPHSFPQWQWAREHVQDLSCPDFDMRGEMKSPTGTFIFSGYSSFSLVFFPSILLSTSSSFYTKSGSRDDPIPHTLHLCPLKYHCLIYIWTSIYIFMFHSLKTESANFPSK